MTETKTLEEICEIRSGTKIDNNTNGIYQVFGTQGKTFMTTNTYNREGFNVIVSKLGLSLECVHIVDEKIFVNHTALTVKPKTNEVLHKYIGYYLFENQDIVYGCSKGIAIATLDLEKFRELKIPIPTIEEQEDIIRKIEELKEINKQLEKQIENNKYKSKLIVNRL